MGLRAPFQTITVETLLIQKKNWGGGGLGRLCHWKNKNKPLQQRSPGQKPGGGKGGGTVATECLDMAMGITPRTGRKYGSPIRSWEEKSEQ